MAVVVDFFSKDGVRYKCLWVSVLFVGLDQPETVFIKHPILVLVNERRGDDASIAEPSASLVNYNFLLNIRQVLNRSAKI